MTFLDTLASYLTTPAYAEEPAQQETDEEETQATAGDKDSGSGEAATDDADSKEGDDGSDAGDDAQEGEGEDGGDDGGEEDEDEDEEEEEPEDLMPKFQAECAKTGPCSHAKTELEECTERVKQWDEDDRPLKQKGPKEDCVEEFFEYTHCITQCAAPKLFKALA